MEAREAESAASTLERFAASIIADAQMDNLPGGGAGGQEDRSRHKAQVGGVTTGVAVTVAVGAPGQWFWVKLWSLTLSPRPQTFMPSVVLLLLMVVTS
jgi:hypothetical protein